MVSKYCSHGPLLSSRRALANGLAVGGAGIGNLVLPPVMRLCLDIYGFKNALLILSGLMLNVCIGASLLRPPQFYTQGTDKNRRELQKIHTSSQEGAKIEEPSTKCCTHACRFQFFCPGSRVSSKGVMFEWKLLKNPLFFLYGVSSFFFFCGFPGLFIIITPMPKQSATVRKMRHFS